MKPSILAVIVLYKTAALDSVSATSLKRALTTVGQGNVRFQVLFFDNSPVAGVAPGMFENEDYVSVPENAGLACAYNRGMLIAEKEGFEWLLTLDQDTSLPEDFLVGMVEGIGLAGDDAQIAGIVPQIFGSGRRLSPYTFRWGAVPKWFPPDCSGVMDRATYALNSASLFRLSALRQVGGYDNRFWLDASDHMMFHALAAYGKRIYVAGEIHVQHALSVLDKGTSMPGARYENMLAAESAFWDLHMGLLAHGERNLKLFVRLMRQCLRGESELRNISFRYLGLRLLRTRRYRLARWESKLPNPPKDAIEPEPPKPMISVCMASYNGERYIEEQIRSILPQLAMSDELVVVDDASSDSTRERIMRFGDARVRLIAQAKNRGVVETFEHAVRSAVGDILFLCDGDDIWAPEKVEKVVHAFAVDPDAMVVCTGMKLIDENGEDIDGSDYLEHRRFSASLSANFVRNQFQGSAMAFRSQLLSVILPFPKGRLLLHDAWIGSCNIIWGGETIYIAEPLLHYRRHSSNASQRLNLRDQLMKRVQLIVALATRCLRGSKRMPVAPVS
jgi:glycosyltransferase involved in cell wall biosynthesis